MKKKAVKPPNDWDDSEVERRAQVAAELKADHLRRKMAEGSPMYDKFRHALLPTHLGVTDDGNAR